MGVGCLWPDELCPLALVVPGGRSPLSPSATVVALCWGLRNCAVAKEREKKRLPRLTTQPIALSVPPQKSLGFAFVLPPPCLGSAQVPMHWVLQ